MMVWQHFPFMVGFPNKLYPSYFMKIIHDWDNDDKLQEERRLFYVAMTRTKNRVFFIAPEKNPSEFLLEIKQDYKNVVLKGNWNDNPEEIPSFKKACPMCGYPMQFRYKNAYGLRLYICTNEPEVCGFMTNEVKAGKLSVIKCDQCRDGYLVVKPAKENDYFLGCTNYKKDKTGCSRVMARSYFYEYMGIKDDTPAEKVEIKSGLKTPPPNREATQVRPEAESMPESIREHHTIESPEFAPVYYKQNDLSSVIQIILQCLEDISTKHFYGISMLTDVLRGSSNKKLLDRNLNNTSLYGSLSHISREDILFIVEWLIKNECILQTKGLYPVLHPTYEGRHYNETITRNKLIKLKRLLEQEDKEN